MKTLKVEENFYPKPFTFAEVGGLFFYHIYKQKQNN